MRKKLLLMLVMICCIALVATFFAACNDDKTDGPGGEGTGTETPGGEEYIDESVVLEAYAARMSADLAAGVVTSGEHWIAVAYGMDISDPDWLNENLGDSYDPAHGVVAWGVVGSHGDEDIGDGQNAEYIWTDSSVFWVKYESAEMAQEKGLASFGLGVTWASIFPAAEAFEGFAFRTVGSYVVAARVEQTLDDFFAADTAQCDAVIADAVQWIDMTEEPCLTYMVATVEEYFDISCAQMYNPDYLEGDKQIDCRYYDDAAELAAAVEEFRQEYEGEEGMTVYAQGSWLVIADAGRNGKPPKCEYEKKTLCR